MTYIEVTLDPGVIVSDLYREPRVNGPNGPLGVTTEQSLEEVIVPQPYQSGEKPISYGVTDVYKLDEYGVGDGEGMDQSIFQVEICRRVTQGNDGRPLVHEDDAYAVLYLNSPEGADASVVRTVVVGSPRYRDYKASHLDDEQTKGYLEGSINDVLNEKGVVIDEQVYLFLSEMLPGYASGELACAWDRQATTVLESIAYRVGEEHEPDAPLIIENYHAKLDVDGTDDPYFNVAYRVRDNEITSDFGSGEWYARRHDKMQPVECEDPSA